jgi:UDP-glucose 4-epimerase
MLGQLVRRVGLVDFSPEQMRFLQFGRVVDTDRLGAELGSAPMYTTVQAFDDFVTGRGLRLVTPENVQRVEQALLNRLNGGRVAHA